MKTKRVLVTKKAAEVIAQLKEKHGELMFHQSGGCCDGSSLGSCVGPSVGCVG